MDTLRDRLLDLASEAPKADVPQSLIRRTHRRIARNVVAGACAIVVVVVGSLSVFRTIGRAEPAPATPPHVQGSAKVAAWMQAAQGQIVVNSGAIGGALTTVDPSGGLDSAVLKRAGIPQNWSADGSRLLVQTGKELEVLSSNGTRTAVVSTDDLGWGSLSPDGSTVVYQADLGLDAVSVGGGAPHILVAGGKGQPRLSDPAWSPDGTEIAYVAIGPGATTTSISLINADGTGRRVLVDLSGHLYTEAGWISWSPDGSRLAFALNRCKTCARIYVVSSDGSGLRKVTRQDGVSPVWSPDGSRVAFIGPEGVATMNADGSDLVSLGIPALPPYLTWNPVPRSSTDL
jgi:hypothetical protein